MSTSPNHYNHQPHPSAAGEWKTPTDTDSNQWPKDQVPATLHVEFLITTTEYNLNNAEHCPDISRSCLITKSCPLILRIFLDSKFPIRLVYTKTFLVLGFLSGETLRSIWAYFSSFAKVFFSSSQYTLGRSKRASGSLLCMFLFIFKAFRIFFNNIFCVWQAEGERGRKNKENSRENFFYEEIKKSSLEYRQVYFDGECRKRHDIAWKCVDSFISLMDWHIRSVVWWLFSLGTLSFLSTLLDPLLLKSSIKPVVNKIESNNKRIAAQTQ